jgi:hypothetical protein
LRGATIQTTDAIGGTLITGSSTENKRNQSFNNRSRPKPTLEICSRCGPAKARLNQTAFIYAGDIQKRHWRCLSGEPVGGGVRRGDGIKTSIKSINP